MRHPLLLAEPNALLRQTVALTAASIQIGPMLQAASLKLAERMLGERTFCGVILPLDSDEAQGSQDMFALIKSVRAGATLSPPDTPIFVTATVCNRTDAELLMSADVQRVLIKPFKVRLLLDALAAVRNAPGALRRA